MTGAFLVHEPGGPEALRWQQIDIASPGPGEALVEHSAVGLNYIDTYHRSGLYPMPLPTRIGVEGAGVVAAVGDGVSRVAVGDRVGYAMGLGGYAEANVVPAERLVKIPDTITDEQMAASLLKGLTACYLLRRLFVVTKDHTVLVHAAAGGMGLLLCQWASHLGATVIGTTSSEEKAALARANGADHVVLYDREDVAGRVRDITGGAGVQVAYDGVGAATHQATLDSMARRGMVVCYGNASGNAPPVDPRELMSKGSLFYTRPSLADYAATTDELEALAADWLEVLQTGVVNVQINQRYPLAEAVQAHRDLEARRTTGSTVFTV